MHSEKQYRLLCFCTVPAIRNFIANLMSEVIATFVLVFVVAAIFSKAVAGARPGTGSGRLFGCSPGLGYRPVAWWTYWLRDQSRSRLGAAACTRDTANREQGVLRLGLWNRAHSRTSHRRRTGWVAAACHHEIARISGLDFQQQLQKAGHQISIIFITGYGDISMTGKAMKVGALEFFTKPFDGQKLIDTVEQILAGDSVRRK
jgi:Response regulator receiver domain